MEHLQEAQSCLLPSLLCYTYSAPFCLGTRQGRCDLEDKGLQVGNGSTVILSDFESYLTSLV